MPENKIIPVQIPGYTYSVAPTDIGSGYAKGIESAGQSIAGAIRGVMGGIDSAGNVQQGVLGQNQSVNDMLGFLTTAKDAQGNPVLSQDAYDSIMSKGLGARQAALGMYMGMFKENYQSQIEQQNKLAQIAASGGEQRTTQQVVEQGAMARQQAQAAAEMARMKAEYEEKLRQAAIVAGQDPSKRFVTPPPATAPPVTSPLQQTLQLGKTTAPSGGSILDQPISFGLR